MEVHEAMIAVQSVIGHPRGQCYPATEAVYHLAGGKDAGLTPMVCRYSNDELTHWWLRGPNQEVYDPTSAQFPESFPYEQGKGCGFLTKEPSKRAREIMEKING
jgi:hypothetical protein